MKDDAVFYYMQRCVGVSKRHYKEMITAINSGLHVFVRAKKIDAYLDGCESYMGMRPSAKLAKPGQMMLGPVGPDIYSITLTR